MMTVDNAHRSDSGTDIEIGLFRDGDGEGITALFREVYGEGYPIKLFYDPAAIARANAAGDYYSITARQADAIVGVEHLYRSAPYPCVYEAGAGLVRKECRNLGLTKRLLEFICEEWVPRQPDIHEVFGEPVCNHPYMQKAVAGLRFVEMALEIALMPAEAYTQEQSATGRVAALLIFRSYRPKPHRVFLPPVYAKELRFLYPALDEQRELATADEPLPTAGDSEIIMTVFDFARVARIAVAHAGADFIERLTALEHEATARGVWVFQVWLNLAQPGVGAAVEHLRQHGYFLGGPLPRWFDTDGLLMQRLLCPPDFEQIQLHSDRSREILALVRQDWDSIQTGR
jgi:GNAT superfamily N-acetyltransferase